VVWFRKAAEQGDLVAQSIVGDAYFFGRGVAQDYVEALKWATLAAAQSSGEVQKLRVKWRDEFAQRMTPAQIAEAQKRASDWAAAFERRKK
jgi:hypothetical protein